MAACTFSSWQVVVRSHTQGLMPQGLQLRARWRLTHPPQPLLGLFYRPVMQKRLLPWVVLVAPPQTARAPRLRTPDQLGPQGVPFHVAANRQKVFILSHRKGPEPALVEVAHANVVVVCMPTFCVCQRQAVAEIRKFAVLPISSPAATTGYAPPSIGLVKRHRGYVLQPRNGPRGPRLTTIGLPQLSHRTPVSGGGDGRPSASTSQASGTWGKYCSP
jgi:hypothetical protein